MRLLLLVGLLSAVAIPATAQGAEPGAMTLYPAGQIKWQDGPASLPKGAQMAILEGDPIQPGPFTIRFRFPNGFRVGPHLHTQTEHATVLAGVLHLGMGERFDSAATQPLAAGSFGFWPAGTPHYAWAEGETILQLHGQGPWTISYLNPADDPRKQPRP